ncbi:MAG: BtpA/SgcQ family protein [Hyphomicrobiales bacterium]
MSIPPVIAALQIPAFTASSARSMAWYEDFLLSNAKCFVENGIKAVKIQDETVVSGHASERTIARMASLGHAMRREFADLCLGIIVQAHDPKAALAIADACGASFVRQKIFAAAAVNAEGVRQALGPDAVAYRDSIGRPDIQIYADVQDRTSVPLENVPSELAAHWTERLGADALVITGSDFADTKDRIAKARAYGVTAPILIGGSVTKDNVQDALSVCDSVVVSSSLVRPGAAPDALDRWDPSLIRQFMERANA